VTSPSPEPYDRGHLHAPDGAAIYWETSGNPQGRPALWLHGGPGGSLGSGTYRRPFDPERHLIVGMDQRGSGRSTPSPDSTPPDLRQQSTQQLIADIEQLRSLLGVDRWVVSGASWGTTLALAYALEHPDRVHGLALVAVTTTSREEVEWITEGVGRVFPEAWHEFELASGREPDERIVDAYARRLASADAADRATAARAWNRWESVHVSLDTPELRGRSDRDEAAATAFATLVTHYWSHDGFLPGDRAILARLDELADIPCHLVHGRRDISGPTVTAWRLHERWPASTLTVVEDEGHGGPQQMAALATALDRLARG